MRLWFRMGSFALLVLLYPVCSYLLGWQSSDPSLTSTITTGTTVDRRLEGGQCPEPTDPNFVIVYISGVLWIFVGLAIIADELFVPALDLIAAKMVYMTSTILLVCVTNMFFS
jgi:hypothetical protein